MINKNPDIKTTRATFKLLWDMVNTVEEYDYEPRSAGTIISNYAGIIDDRINNSGHSQSVNSLKLYTTEQLEKELKDRSKS